MLNIKNIEQAVLAQGTRLFTMGALSETQPSSSMPNILFATHCSEEAVRFVMDLLEVEERPDEQLNPGVNVHDFCAAAPQSQERYRGTIFSVAELRNTTLVRDTTGAVLRNIAQRTDAIVFVYDVELVDKNLQKAIALQQLLEWVLESSSGQGRPSHPPPLLALAVSSTGDMVSLEGAASVSNDIGLSLSPEARIDNTEPNQGARRALREGMGTLY